MVAIVGTAHSVVPADIDLLLGGLAHTVEIIFMVHDLLQAHCNAVGALQAKKTIAQSREFIEKVKKDISARKPCRRSNILERNMKMAKRQL